MRGGCFLSNSRQVNKQANKDSFTVLKIGHKLFFEGSPVTLNSVKTKFYQDKTLPSRNSIKTEFYQDRRSPAKFSEQPS
jgi:hypothetical protein